MTYMLTEDEYHHYMKLKRQNEEIRPSDDMRLALALRNIANSIHRDPFISVDSVRDMIVRMAAKIESQPAPIAK